MTRLIGFASVLSLLIGCGQYPADQLGDVQNATPTTAFNVAGAPTVEFSVPDMMCADGCGAAVEATLAKQPGALDVDVVFETKSAIVAVDEDKFDADKAVAALVDKMFPNSKLKSAELAKPHAASDAVVH
jgi:copper chaperone CopZ